MFASNRPDDLRRETYYNARRKRQIVVLRTDRQTYDYEWRPNYGHYLFEAEDIDGEAKVIQLWIALWRQTDPAFDYFGEYINAGNTYSPDRFLTLYKAAETTGNESQASRTGNYRSFALARVSKRPSATATTMRSPSWGCASITGTWATKS